MQRKPGFPVANCTIKMPDGMPPSEPVLPEDDGDQHAKRQQLINFGHSQWGYKNWSWSVTKQDLDFVDFTNGKHCAGVVAFVSVTVKTFDIHRENIGYATSLASNKGLAIYKSRKCAVTNALRETLLSFGGKLASELVEQLETHTNPASEPLPENNLNLPNKTEPKNSPLVKNQRTDLDSNTVNLKPQMVPAIKNAVPNLNPPPPPVAKAHPMPANQPPPVRPPLPPANARPAPPPARPNSNVSFVLQPVMPPLYAPPQRLAPPHVTPHMYPNTYYDYGPWHFTYESFDRHHGNVNLNFNMPPKNLVVNSRSGSVECKNACGIRPHGPEGEPIQYGPPSQNQGCWIKPTIFYDGFWTEQKVKKWVAEQVEKQFPEDVSQSASPNNGQDSSASK